MNESRMGKISEMKFMARENRKILRKNCPDVDY